METTAVTTPATCLNCSGAASGTGTINGNHWTGTEYVRANVCVPCAEQARANGKSGASYFQSAPRKPRAAKRAPQPLYGDFATVAMLNGIRTDGTGRRAR